MVSSLESPTRPDDAPETVPARRWWQRWWDAAVAHPFRTTSIVALVARLAFVLIEGPITKARYLIPDEQQYVELADTVKRGYPADVWFPNYGHRLYSDTWPLTGVLRFLYDVFGTSRHLGQLWSVVIGVLVAVVTVALARRVLSPPFALLAGLIAALVPSQILWSSVVLRETWVWLALAGIAYSLATAVTRRGTALVLPLAGVIAGLWALHHLRNQTLLAAAWAVALTGWFVHGRRLRLGAGLAVVGLAAPVVLGLGIGGYGYIKQNVPTLSERRTYLALDADTGVTDVTQIAPASTVPEVIDPETGEVIGGGGPSGPPPTLPNGDPAPTTTTIVQTTPTTIRITGPNTLVVRGYHGELYAVEESYGASARHLPRGLKAFLLQPFPWEATPKADVMLAKFENLGWYALYALALAGLVIGRRKPELVFPLLVVGAICGIAFVTQGNVGTAFRHRGQLLWALVIFAMIPLERMWERWKAKRAIAGAGG
jgi:hypothetical protein